VNALINNSEHLLLIIQGFVGVRILDCSLRLVLTASSWVLYAHIVEEWILDTYSEKAKFSEK